MRAKAVFIRANVVRRIGSSFALAIALLSEAVASPPAVLTYTGMQHLEKVGTYSTFYLDGNGLSVQDVLAPAVRDKFQPYALGTPNFAATPDAVWLEFSIRNATDDALYLEVGSAFMDDIQLHRIADAHALWTKISGDDHAFADREVEVTTYLFALDIPKDSTYTYLLRVESVQPLFFPLRVGHLKYFTEDTQSLSLLQGLYLGLMLILLLYNFFLYFPTRDTVYLYYCAYLLSITLFMSFIYMQPFQYLWPDHPGINRYAVATSAITMICSLLFTRQFLSTRTQLPRYHRISNFFIALALIDLALVFSPYKIAALNLAQGGILLMAIFLAVLGFVSLRRGYRPARFYLLAWGFLILGFIAAILESVNLLPVMHYINGMQIGSAIEATLLSFALADRINQYKLEREQAQAVALKEANEKAELIARQNEELDRKVTERTAELVVANSKLSDTIVLVEKEKKVSQDLLLNILPAEVAAELMQTGHSTARHYANVTVLFTDFVNFTGISASLGPEQLVEEINTSFKAFDGIMEEFGLEKIKTIGDAYLAVCGLPHAVPDHAARAVDAALRIRDHMLHYGGPFKIRVGLHSGPVVAGIVGVKKFAYDIWGDTVNMAARMEQNCEAGQVNISEATYELVKGTHTCIHRGRIEAKNKGMVEMHFVVGRV